MLLLEQFEHLTLHPKNAARLKALVLQLAVQGKLTESWRSQNPATEPAADLLKRIEAEKAQLVKKKKIKKEKPLESVTEDEITFEVPEGWSWCRLGNLGFCQTGTTPSKNDPNNVGSFIPFIGPGDMSASGISYLGEGLSEEGLTKGRLIPVNSILMVCIGGSIGKLAINEQDVSCNQQINTITPLVVPSKLVKYFLSSSYFQKAVLGRATGSATPIINKGKWESIPVPLPPLAEQEAIVARVEELMQKIEKLERQTAESIQLKQHLGAAALQQLTAAEDEELEQNWLFLKQHFQIMFDEATNIKKLRETVLQLAVQGKLTATWRKQNPTTESASELLKHIQAEKAQLVKEKKIKKEKPLEPISEVEVPYTLPEGWVWCRLGEICDNITSGSTPDKKYFYETPGIPYLKVYNIKNQKIDFEYKHQFIDEAVHAKQLKRSTLYPGDVIMNIVGPPLGKTAIIPENYPEWNCNQAIVFFRPIQLNLNFYIYTFLLAGTFLKEIELIGTAGQDNISVTKSKNILLPLPPLAEQEAIVAKVDQLMQLCDELEQQIKQSNQEAEALMQAVVQEALQVQEEVEV